MRNDFQSWPFSLTKSYGSAPGGTVCLTAKMVTSLRDYARNYYNSNGVPIEVYHLISLPKIWSCKTWVVLPIKFRSMRWPDQAIPLHLGTTKETLSMSGALTQRKCSGVTLSHTYFWWLLVYLQKSLLGSDYLVPQSKPRGIVLPWKFMWRFVNYRALLTICRFLNICLFVCILQVTRHGSTALIKRIQEKHADFNQLFPFFRAFFCNLIMQNFLFLAWINGANIIEQFFVITLKMKINFHILIETPY